MDIYASSNSYVNTQSAHAKSTVAETGTKATEQTSASPNQTVQDEYVPSDSQTKKATYHLTSFGNTSSQPDMPSTGFDLRVEMKSPGYRLEKNPNWKPENGSVGEYYLKPVSTSETTATESASNTTAEQKPDYAESVNAEKEKIAEVSPDFLKSLQERKSALEDRIGQMLAESGIALDRGETLKLEVGSKGTIAVGEGIADEEKASAIESVLAADETLGRDLFVTFGQQGLLNYFARGGSNEFTLTEGTSIGIRMMV